MTDAAPREQLTELLAPGLAAYCTRTGVDPGRWRGGTLSEHEAAGFLRAVEAGIVVLDLDAAVCTMPDLGVTVGGKRYQLYMTYAGGAANPGPTTTWSWREMFDQIGFATELVLDHGWPRRGVQLEVDRLDVAAGPPESVLTNPLLAAEVKVTDTGGGGLAAMMAVFAELNGTGPAAVVGAGARNNAVAKYHSIQHLHPAVFVEAAPGVRRAHELTYLPDGTVLFTRMASVPAPADLGWDAASN